MAEQASNGTGEPEGPAGNPKYSNQKYIGVGLAIGVAVGVATDTIALGIALGLVFGILLSRAKSE